MQSGNCRCRTPQARFSAIVFEEELIGGRKQLLFRDRRIYEIAVRGCHSSILSPSQRFGGQSIETSFRDVALELLVPCLPVVFDEPVAKRGQLLGAQTLDLTFDSFNFRHARVSLRQSVARRRAFATRTS
jgi:hypothetical protein